MSEQNSPEEDLTDFKLKISYWYVTHKLQLRNLLILFLILLNVGLFGFAIARGAYLFFIDTPRYIRTINQLPQDLVDYNYFRQDNRPQTLQINGFSALPSVENNSDYVALLRNTNTDWVASQVLVQLVSGSQIIAEQTTFVYPNDEKYIAFFNKEAGAQGTLSVRLANVDWQRRQNFEQFSQPRLNFTTSDIEFTPVTRSGIPGELPISNLDFTIKNTTAYSYWKTGIYMVLSSGRGVVGVNYIALDQFKSGDVRDVSIKWQQSLPAVTSVRILPEVDILDDGVYMDVE